MVVFLVHLVFHFVVFRVLSGFEANKTNAFIFICNSIIHLSVNLLLQQIFINPLLSALPKLQGRRQT